MSVTAIITGGGKGVRLGQSRPKQFLELNKKLVIEHTLDVFDASEMIDDVVVVLPKDELFYFQQEQKKRQFGKKISRLVIGGDTRQESVRQGLMAITQNPDLVVIHDAARCLLTQSELHSTIQACQKGWQGAVCGMPVRDTLKKVLGKQIMSTQNRENVWAMQTPQVFQFSLIKHAYEKAQKENFKATDDAQIAEYVGAKLCIVQGKPTNFKITFTEDLSLAEAIFKQREKEELEND